MDGVMLFGNKLSEGVVGLGIADDGTRSFSEIDVLKDYGKRSRPVMMVMLIMIMGLEMNGAGVLRNIGGIRCRMMKLSLGLALRLVEMIMDVFGEPGRMAAHAPQTEEIAAESRHFEAVATVRIVMLHDRSFEAPVPTAEGERTQAVAVTKVDPAGIAGVVLRH